MKQVEDYIASHRQAAFNLAKALELYCQMKDIERTARSGHSSIVRQVEVVRLQDMQRIAYWATQVAIVIGLVGHKGANLEQAIYASLLTGFRDWAKDPVFII